MDLLNIANGEMSKSNDKKIASNSLIRFFGNTTRTTNPIGRHHTFGMCEEIDVSDPITFTTSDSYLKLSGWKSPSKGTLSLKFRTNEPNGVLLYSTGTAQSHNNTIHRDYIALELLDGHLYFLINLGFTPVKVKATVKRIDDSHWHTIIVRRSGGSGQLILDDIVNDFVIPGVNDPHLDLSDSIYLGGLPRHTGNRVTYTPPELWSASLGYGYIGCVRDLFLNDQIVDIAAYATKQDSGSVKPSCHSLASQCTNSPCQNGGNCTDGWNRYSCTCTHTSFTGSVCSESKSICLFLNYQNIYEDFH